MLSSACALTFDFFDERVALRHQLLQLHVRVLQPQLHRRQLLSHVRTAERIQLQDNNTNKYSRRIVTAGIESLVTAGLVVRKDGESAWRDLCEDRLETRLGLSAYMCMYVQTLCTCTSQQTALNHATERAPNDNCITPEQLVACSKQQTASSRQTIED